MPLKFCPAKTARNCAGTDTRPFLSMRLTYVERNSATRCLQPLGSAGVDGFNPSVLVPADYSTTSSHSDHTLGRCRFNSATSDNPLIHLNHPEQTQPNLG